MVVHSVLYGPAISQSDWRKAGVYQLAYGMEILLTFHKVFNPVVLVFLYKTETGRSSITKIFKKCHVYS